MTQSFTDAFGKISEALAGGDAVLLLSIDLIDEDPDNPRTHFDEAELAALAETIGRKGLLQPVTVRPQDPAGRYRLRFGARRLRAARIAGLSEVRALIQAEEADPAEAIVEQLIENDQREGLSTAELANAVDRLVDLGVKQAEIGRRLGRPKEQIAMLAAVREMPPELRALAPQLGLRTLYELASAWKADAARTRVWLSGRSPSSITQAAARELAGRPTSDRRLVRDPSDGSIRATIAVPAPVATTSEKASKPKASPAPLTAPDAAAAARFEVHARGVRGTLVLDNVLAPSAAVLIRTAEGEVVTVAADKVKIVRVLPG